MGARRILLAVELASYRQSLAAAIRDLRPHVEVFEVEPRYLDGEVTRLGPDLVICSRVTPTVRQGVADWVELYPDSKPHSTFCLGGIRRSKRDVALSDILALCASPP